MASTSSKRVLLTGANGYLAQHILSQLLSAGHSVRGVVRSSSKVSQLRASPAFSSYPASQLDFAVVADITAPGAFDAALRSEPPFDWVIHTASPFNYRKAAEAAGASNADNFLGPAIKGTTEILSGVTRVAPDTVRRVVLTSSTAAVFNWEKGNPLVTQPARVFTGADWNPISREEGLTTTTAVRAYQASKTYAERAAWEFVETRKPGFDLVALNPPMIYGPLLDPDQLSGPHDLNQSTWNIYSQLLDPRHQSTDPVPPTARIYTSTTPEAGGKRFVLCAGEMSMQRIANILRAALPEKQDTVPRGSPDAWKMEEGRFTASSADAKNILGLEFRNPESTIEDMGRQMVALEKKSAH
ncbi:hypothetical protein G7054_g11772 [Neopestalotiopsis clavispora]|nr:hypothetical protein G7054_g11772 [Neopestalotiopsis clavispora]